MSDNRPEDQPGWAAPDLAPRGPDTGGTPTSPPAPTAWFPPATPGGGAPTVPTPYTAPGAPTRKRGKGWLIALVAALGTIVVMVIAGTVVFVTRTLPPFNGANDFIDAVERGDDNAATNHLCSADRADPQRAIQIVSDTLTDHQSVNVNPIGVDRSGSTAKVDFTVTYHGGKSSQSFVLPMVEEHGSWKACPPT